MAERTINKEILNSINAFISKQFGNTKNGNRY